MTMSPITQRIKAIMAARGISRAELGRATGIPYHRLNPWFVRAAAKPNAEDIEAVASYLKVPIGHLINGDPVPDPTTRDWILKTYDNLPRPDQQSLETFVRFLKEQHDTRDKERDPE